MKTVLAVVALIFGASIMILAQALGRPNVLFIISDDLNSDLGCYGHSLVQSPNIDLLAKRGVRFDRAYCQAPVCNPTRASIYSGLLPESVGVLDNYTRWPTRLEGSQYMPDYFRSQRYFTGTIGKVLDHGRVPRQPFWDLEVPEWGKYPKDDQIGEKGPVPTRITSYWASLTVEDEATGDGDVARRAVQTLEERAKQAEPFFLAVGFRRPHAPYAAPRRYFDLYPKDEIVLPQVPAEHPSTILEAASNGHPFRRDRALKSLRGYYASISFMDAQVGILMEALDRLRLSDETIVVFTSDHGYHTGHHGMWHKETLFEQSARVPLIIAAPGKAHGAVSPRVVELLDLYPTLAELSGLATLEALEGMSLVPLLEDPKGSWPGAAVTIEGRADKDGKRTLIGRSVRTERYRYTEWEEGRRGVELYDHTNDPNEFVNLAQKPESAEVVGNLRQLLRSRLAR